MKSFSITAFRADPYNIVEDIAASGEEVLLTSKGKVVAKVVPLDDEGPFKPAFVKEVKRRLKHEKSIPAEQVFKELW